MACLTVLRSIDNDFTYCWGPGAGFRSCADMHGAKESKRIGTLCFLLFCCVELDVVVAFLYGVHVALRAQVQYQKVIYFPKACSTLSTTRIPSTQLLGTWTCGSELWAALRKGRKPLTLNLKLKGDYRRVVTM